MYIFKQNLPKKFVRKGHLPTALSLAILAALSACGGNNDGAENSAQSAASSKTTAAESTSTSAQTKLSVARSTALASSADVTIAGIDYAQTILYSGTDPELLLVADKDVLVKVNATSSTPDVTPPAGVLEVTDSSGTVVARIALTTPTAALSSTVAETPDKASSYYAVLPGQWVFAGMRLTATLDNGQTLTSEPRVGKSNSMTLMTVPVQIQGTTGTVSGDAGSFLEQRAPVSKVTTINHPVFTSTLVTTLPTTNEEWNVAMQKIVGELADLHTTEGAPDNSHYFGFVPKRMWGGLGLANMGGTAAVGLDWPDYPEVVNSTVVHEVGHNFSLMHAPGCETPNDADPAYPYPDGNLGGNGHYRWTYLAASGVFIDPHDVNRHDVMSYCLENTEFYSDYNYQKIQAWLNPQDAVRVRAAQKAAAGPQDLVLISGVIAGSNSELRPLKSFQGQPTAPQNGPYVLRIVTASGTIDTPFATNRIDHRAGMEQFSFSIPDPGAVTSISILSNDQVMLEKHVADASTRTASRLAASRVTVEATETSGGLKLTWDAARYPYLSVTHVGKQRATLSLDLHGGSATLPLTGVPAGGSFEFSLSDGLNSVRQQQAR